MDQDAVCCFFVIAPPRVLQLDEPIEAFHWNIPYKVTGYPLPNVTWLKDGQPLVQSDVIFERATTLYNAVIIGSLTFTMANHLDNGNYTIVVENVWGTDRRTVEAKFLQFPNGNDCLVSLIRLRRCGRCECGRD